MRFTLFVVALVLALAAIPTQAGVVYRQTTVCRNGRCQQVQAPVQQAPTCNNCPTAAQAPRVVRLAPGQIVRQTVTVRVIPAR
jgi:hypothetical protein